MSHQLLNTLYVQTQGTYLRLEKETVVLEDPDDDDFQIPLHHLGGISVFGNVLLSPFLLHKCAKDGRTINWFTRGGRYRGRLAGPTTGNVLLRRDQHRALSEPKRAVELARAFVEGKITNQRRVLQRAARDGVRDEDAVGGAIDRLHDALEALSEEEKLDKIRGVEGNAARSYFGVFDELLLEADPGLVFIERSRRPPTNPVNAMLSFAYAIATRDCEAALEGVGLDPQIGFLHALRPGRPALALDLVEEFRSVIADRAVLTLVNRGQIDGGHFDQRPGGATLLNEDGRSIFLKHWQERKRRKVQHPILDRRVPYGLLPHVQARLLARTVRGDLDRYPSFTPR